MEDKRHNKPQENQKEASSGIAQGVENLKSTITHRPELQGWLLFIGGILLLLYGFGFLAIVNYVIIALGAYLILYGGYRAQLIHRVKEVIEWTKNKLGGKN